MLNRPRHTRGAKKGLYMSNFEVKQQKAKRLFYLVNIPTVLFIMFGLMLNVFL